MFYAIPDFEHDSWKRLCQEAYERLPNIHYKEKGKYLFINREDLLMLLSLSLSLSKPHN